MLNIHELERRWLHYKIRSLFPVVIAVLVTVIFLVTAIFVWPLVPTDSVSKAVPTTIKPATVLTSSVDSAQPVTTEQALSENADSSQKAKSESALSSQQRETKSISQEPLIEEKSRVVLKPSLQFMHTIKEEVQPDANTDVQPVTITSAYTEEVVISMPLDTVLVPSEEVPSKPPEPIKQPVEKPAKVVREQTALATQKRPKVANTPAGEGSKITIITKEDVDDLKDVLRRFSKNKNPALSLFITKRYYAMEQYQKAYNYALITNEIDNNIEDSWIVFAKSLVKLGQKEKAIETLTSYISHSHSIKAKILLENIQQGRFK